MIPERDTWTRVVPVGSRPTWVAPAPEPYVPYTRRPAYIAGYQRGQNGAIYALAYDPSAETDRARVKACNDAAEAYGALTTDAERGEFMSGYTEGWDEWMAENV